MDGQNKGKTLWEMFQERLHGGGNGAGIAFFNPLALKPGSAVEIPYANGPEFAEHDFSVQEIREYTRRIGGQDFRFTDYVLRGVNTKSFAAEDVITLRLRSVPNQAGTQDQLLLHLYDEFEFAQDFVDVLKDTTGIFEVTNEKSQEKETFRRINDLRELYEAAVLVVTEVGPDGKAAAGKTSSVKLEYWDYWREVKLGDGAQAREFLFVEMNSETGWFQLWRGREFFS